MSSYASSNSSVNNHNEFIDLAVLLTNNPQPVSHKLVYKCGEITIQPETQRHKMYSVEQLTTAFISFISIYCAAHPGATKIHV